MSGFDEELILVDEFDSQTGVGKKLDIHQRGILHRAFSIFLWDDYGRLLIQKRALNKYHSGGLWANSCCGHPRPGEVSDSAAIRRVREELGVEVRLAQCGSHIYRADVGNGLEEHEFVHLFTGILRGDPIPNPSEVADFRWIEMQSLEYCFAANHNKFSAWFNLYFRELPWQSIISQATF